MSYFTNTHYLSEIPRVFEASKKASLPGKCVFQLTTIFLFKIKSAHLALKNLKGLQSCAYQSNWSFEKQKALTHQSDA